METMNEPGKFIIMVDDKVVGLAKNVKISIAKDKASTKEFSEPFRAKATDKSWKTTGSTTVNVSRGVLHDMFNGKYDVVIGTKPLRRLPRKMKKAYRSDYPRNTKWLRKVHNYIKRNLFHIRDAEIQATINEHGLLETTITGGTFDNLINNKDYGKV